jgi:hypothetical protein
MMPIISRSPTQAGTAAIEPRASGSPAPTRSPPSIATSPAAMTGATSGTMSRLTSGAISATRPNEATTIGSVASWAAIETPRLSASQRGARPPVHRSIRSVAALPHAMRPAVASDDSWNPASATRPGSTTSSATAAQPSAAAARLARPVSRATSTTPAMSPARSTDGDAPANAI